MHDATHAVGVVQDIIGEPANRNRLARYVEPTLTVGSAIAAEPINILSGLLQSGESGQDLLELFGFEPYEESPRPSQSLGRMMEVGDKLTYSPRTPEGQAGLQSLKDAMVSVMDTLGVDEAINYLNTTIVPNLQKAFGEEAAKEIGSAVLMAVPMIRRVPGIRAYHGSPHDFDEFSMEQIGTGEGAQAYGHGLYFAEAEDVAKGYRDNISRFRNREYKGSFQVDLDTPSFESPEQSAINTVFSVMESSGLPAKKVIESQKKRLQSDIQNYKKDLDANKNDPLRIRETRDPTPLLLEDSQSLLSEIENLNPEDFKLVKGRLYEVDIDASPDELIDYDLPMSEQSEVVQKALGHTVKNYEGNPEKALRDFLATDYAKAFPEARDVSRAQMILDDPDYDVLIDGQDWVDSQMRAEVGSTFYNTLGSDKGGSAYYRAAEKMGGTEALSKALSDKGIKGIRYKDGFSRGAKDGTSNYVIFDDRLISIAKKYGIAIPAAAALLSQQTGENPESFYQEDNSV